MKVSKGLEFPVVAMPDVGHMPANGEDGKVAVRVLYVAAIWATQRPVVGKGVWDVATGVAFLYCSVQSRALHCGYLLSKIYSEKAAVQTLSVTCIISLIGNTTYGQR